MHAKMQVFLNQPWRQICALLILLFKALFGKDAVMKKKKNCVFANVIKLVKNERETSELKFFY